MKLGAGSRATALAPPVVTSRRPIQTIANKALSGDDFVSRSDSVPAVLVVEAREDLEIARHARELLD